MVPWAVSRRCEFMGIKPQYGNNVSHSHVKTRRRFLPNLRSVGFFSQILGKKITFLVSAKAYRTVAKYNGLDPFLLNYKRKDDLSQKAARVRKLILKKTDA